MATKNLIASVAGLKPVCSGGKPLGEKTAKPLPVPRGFCRVLHSGDAAAASQLQAMQGAYAFGMD